MKIGLYINTNKVGLQFGTTKDRDTFWTAMGNKANGSAQESAEKFGERSIRLHPEHFKARLMWAMDIEDLSPEIISPSNEIKVKPENLTAPAKIEPIMILKEPEVATVTASPPVTAITSGLPIIMVPPISAIPTVQVPIPEISSPTQPMPIPEDDPKPKAHHRSRVFLDWQKRQKAREEARNK